MTKEQMLESIVMATFWDRDTIVCINLQFCVIARASTIIWNNSHHSIKALLIERDSITIITKTKQNKIKNKENGMKHMARGDCKRIIKWLYTF